ncbi:hypothetical protein P170DRAFT_434346 [Aspergillus steynii IBT 23096]|uniref:Uncharacterized protein n=1 Tax=Aspergillus steynii IBT 23096 TaxID=1392250 RepID=A0A2I2GIC6_9EURO|nr:uncharacterized protein P170DRAFT_434346 [Aspergillus steynii IBT 23096]PLB52633.1 hypothetical protein P170DRAFT_434346 [Aspergillus steynii IBT 23096]
MATVLITGEGDQPGGAQCTRAGQSHPRDPPRLPPSGLVRLVYQADIQNASAPANSLHDRHLPSSQIACLFSSSLPQSQYLSCVIPPPAAAFSPPPGFLFGTELFSNAIESQETAFRTGAFSPLSQLLELAVACGYFISIVKPGQTGPTF